MAATSLSIEVFSSDHAASWRRNGMDGHSVRECSFVKSWTRRRTPTDLRSILLRAEQCVRTRTSICLYE